MIRILTILAALALAVPLAVPALAETYTIHVPVASDGPSTWTPEPTAVSAETVTPEPTVSVQPVGTLEPLPPPWVVPEGPHGRYSRPQMTSILYAAGWPEWAIPDALAVTWCESGWVPGVINPASGAHGLFQVMPLHSPRAYGLGYDVWTPLGNAGYSLVLYTEMGSTWWHWVCKPWMALPPVW